ncbi:MAG TPA: hypothetical protein VFU36_17325 [Jatrophihabitans sp.]|nr:hypothetical protein [Jatrophihabitans sp.]
MLSPMMTVLVLTVLWLIVVIPMLVKRNDDRAGERSAARFSSAMRALSARRSLAALTRPAPPADLDSADAVRFDPHAQVFVPGRALRAEAGRRPVPVAMEAMLYPDRVARADLSEARRQMLARRRRSLIVLTVGTVIGLLWAVAAGGTPAWLMTLAFTPSLGGYLLFLRNQALRDRDRRQSRMQRSGLRPVAGYEVHEHLEYQAESTAVQIDDEDIELRGMADTIDLTGLYVEEEYDEQTMRRAV